MVRFNPPQHPDDDLIITVDVGADVDNFQHYLEMYGGASVQSREKLNYFVSMAVLTLSPNHRKSYLVEKVSNKIVDSMREDFGHDYPIDKFDKMLNEWISLAATIKSVLQEYIYDRSTNTVLTYRKYLSDGTLEVILHKDEPEV